MVDVELKVYFAKPCMLVHIESRCHYILLNISGANS